MLSYDTVEVLQVFLNAPGSLSPSPVPLTESLVISLILISLVTQPCKFVICVHIRVGMITVHTYLYKIIDLLWVGVYDTHPVPFSTCFPSSFSHLICGGRFSPPIWDVMYIFIYICMYKDKYLYTIILLLHSIS